MTYQPKTYRAQGGDEFVVASGGKISVETGGDIEVNGVSLIDEVAALSGLDTTELGFLNGAAAGVATASKAAIYDTAGKLRRSSASPAAAGTLISDATVLTAELNAVTGANGTAGVKLPVAAADEVVVVINTDASNNLLVYPVAASQINGLGASNAFTVTPGQMAVFIGRSATLWYVAAATDTVTGLTASAAELNILDGATLAVAELNILDGVTSTAAEINKLDDSAAVMVKGSGVGTGETYASGVFLNGTLKVTRILVDLTTLVSGAADLDIIGDTGGVANAHFGQVTAALNGTIVGGSVTCLEAPVGGATDIDFYSATEGTGAQDADVTTLTETVLITAGGAWTSGAVKGMTTVPAANDYLYIVNGAASAGAFSAGKFLIELYGV